MTHFSFAQVIKGALTGQKNWTPQWPDAQPKAAYDVVIVGAGGHGLGAAYYLAKEHGITNVAVIDKGWLGGGNTGRNTTIIRSNYLYDESARLYDHALDLWEGLSQELNYNVMFSKRGVLMLAHNVHDVQSFQRHVHSNRLNGVDNQWLSAKEAKLFCPPLDISPSARYPVMGAALQRRAGTARHDAVAWGYARGAAARGVDIIQNCPVTAIRRGPDGRVTGVETAKGFIAAKKVAVSAAGHTSVVMETAGVRLPLESYPASGAGLRADQADLPLRRDVELGARLHQPVRQGRARHRLRHRPVRQLLPARRPAADRAHAGGDLRDLPDLPPDADAAEVGRHRRRDARTARRSSARPRCPASTSTAAGAPAASRRRRAPPTSSPTPSPATSRTRSTPPSRSSASPPAA